MVASESRLLSAAAARQQPYVTAAAGEQLIGRKTRDQTGGVCSRTPPVVVRPAVYTGQSARRYRRRVIIFSIILISYYYTAPATYSYDIC